MAIKTIPLSRLETELEKTLTKCAESGDTLVVELPDQRLLSIQSLDVQAGEDSRMSAVAPLLAVRAIEDQSPSAPLHRNRIGGVSGRQTRPEGIFDPNRRAIAASRESPSATDRPEGQERSAQRCCTLQTVQSPPRSYRERYTFADACRRILPTIAARRARWSWPLSSQRLGVSVIDT